VACEIRDTEAEESDTVREQREPVQARSAHGLFQYTRHRPCLSGRRDRGIAFDMPLSPADFVAELDKDNRSRLERITAAATAGEAPPELNVERLLVAALKNEIEATECAAQWIASTPEIDVKLAFARQAGDEAKHYRLLQKRLAALGVDASDHDPFAAGRSPLLAYLSGLESTVERVAAGPFTREALALARNAVFIRFCEEQGDAESAALYRDVIQPDEAHHHELGRDLLLRLATTDVAQTRARTAARRVLELAEELQEIAHLKSGMSRLPGC